MPVGNPFGQTLASERDHNNPDISPGAAGSKKTSPDVSPLPVRGQE